MSVRSVPRRDRIEAVLGRPELARLMQRVRDRLEANGLAASGSVSLPNASSEERIAVARLLAKAPSSAASPRVSLAALDQTLRASRLRVSLVEAVEAMGGPLSDRRGDARRRSAARDRIWEAARSHRAVERHPALDGWLDRMRTTGLPSRLGRADEAGVLGAALDVLAELPAEGTRLALLAARLLGDAHALDRGRAVGILTANALAYLQGSPSPAGAEARRELWARYGVACDDLSCDVLAVGLRPSGDRGAAALVTFAEAGEPVRITLRQLLRSPWRFRHERVFACENPVVVAEAADRLGRSCPPLVCVEGVPTTAALLLLERCADAGAELRYHGDFDWGGIRIGNALVHRLGVAPWRFVAADYRQAVRGDGRAPLHGDPVAAAWDEGLQREMRAAAVAVYEEQVVDLLVNDLGG